MFNFNHSVVLLLAAGLLVLSGCKQDGCTDLNASNYNSEADNDDGSCIFPIINVNPAGDDGDVSGNGGSASDTFTWNNGQSKAELNMDITSTVTGSFQITVKDANGAEVLNEIISDDSNDDSITACSAEGEPGDWTITITLIDFSGDGSYTLSQGC